MKDAFNSFIQKQFEENGYSVLGIVHEDVLFLKNNEHEDYWLVAVGVESYQNQDILFEEMQSSFYKECPLAVKNTSLLILYDTDIDLLESNTLIEIENDPLYFKKYVLCYTNGSFEDLAVMLQESSVADLAMEDDMFDRMLKETNLGTASLLYGIMHKLPFISVKGQNADRDNQEIFFSASSNAGELNDFLDSLPDDENDIIGVIGNLIKVVGNE